MRFIGGTTVLQLQRTLDGIASKGWYPIVDYAKEACRSEDEVKAYYKVMCGVVDDLGPGVAYALKASSFQAASKSEGEHYIQNLVQRIMQHDKCVVMLDAEQDHMKAYETFVYDRLVKEFNKDGPRVYKTYQMYRKDGLKRLANDLERFDNLGVKLVRGAYMKEDAHVLHPNVYDTHKAYDRGLVDCMTIIARNPDRNIKLLVATHNANSTWLAERISHGGALQNRVEFAQLLGMGDVLSHRLVREHGRRVYKYVPFGTLKETLPYLLRRFRENFDILKHVAT